MLWDFGWIAAWAALMAAFIPFELKFGWSGRRPRSLRIGFRESDTNRVTCLLAAAIGTGAFFPTSVGTEWRYEVEVLGAKGSLTQTIEDSKGTPDGTELLISSKTLLGGQTITGFERVVVGHAVLYRLSNSLGNFEPALCLASTETMWEWTGKVGDNNSSRANGRLVAPKRIRVPAGEFETVVYEIELHAGALTTVSRYWFAKGVGWIRIEHELPGGTLIAELTEFRPK